MSSTTPMTTRLEILLGANQIVSAEEELREYAVDGVIPGAIARPTSDAEVVELVRFALSEGLTLIAGGSRSKMEFGMPPARLDIALDMRRMQSIAHYDAGDLTLSVDSGMRLRMLEKVLAEKQQFLPLSVPCYEISTIGGAVASGIDSTLRQQYGTVRDFLIGAEFVDGKGNLCRSGGRVVKNVTGYDLHKLLVGSLGTLGVITRLNFRTSPVPQVFGGFVSSFPNATTALWFKASVESSGLPLANLELLDPSAVGLLRGTLDKSNTSLPVDDTTHWCAYASYEGNESVVQRISRDLETLSKRNSAIQGEELEASTDAALGGVLRESFDWLRSCAPGVTLFRITLPDLSPANLQKLTDIASDAAMRSALLLRSAGVIYFVVMAEGEQLSFIDALTKVSETVFRSVAASQGCATLLHAPQTLKQRINVWGPKRPDFDLMHRIKHAFDPENIFAPGRFVGGL